MQAGESRPLGPLPNGRGSDGWRLGRDTPTDWHANRAANVSERSFNHRARAVMQAGESRPLGPLPNGRGSDRSRLGWDTPTGWHANRAANVSERSPPGPQAPPLAHPAPERHSQWRARDSLFPKVASAPMTGPPLAIGLVQARLVQTATGIGFEDGHNLLRRSLCADHQVDVG